MTITAEHYKKLYKQAFSVRGIALLEKGDSLTEKEKAIFFVDIFQRFHSQLSTANDFKATEDDFKDMLLALKFIVDKNFSNGKHFKPYYDSMIEKLDQTSEGNFQFLERDQPLTKDELEATGPFVSTLVISNLLYGNRQKDFYLLEHEFTWENIPDLDPSSELDEERKKELEKSDLLYGERQEGFDLLERKFNLENMPSLPSLSESGENLTPIIIIQNFSLHSGDLMTLQELFYKKNTCSEALREDQLNPIYLGLRKDFLQHMKEIKKVFEDSFYVSLDQILEVTPFRKFFINTTKNLSNFFKPKNPETFFGRIFNYFSIKFNNISNALYEEHIKNVISQDDFIVNEKLGLMDDLENLEEVTDFDPKELIGNKKIEIHQPIDNLKPKDKLNRILSPKDEQEKLEKELKEAKDLTETRSKLWIIANTKDADEAIREITEKRKSMETITLEEYQSLIVEVAREIDRIGKVEAGHWVDSGAYTFVDPDNKLFNFFQNYYKKVIDEKEEKNCYAYSRDPAKYGYLTVNQSSHPGKEQMGFDFRKFDAQGELINIFESDPKREPKKHILVSKLELGEGTTYFKLEKIGIGTTSDFIQHGFDWFWTRKPVEAMVSQVTGKPKEDESPTRKEHTVDPSIKSAYKEIEEKLIKMIESDDSDILRVSRERKSLKIIKSDTGVFNETEEGFVKISASKQETIKIPKFICEMYDNLKKLVGFLGKDNKEASECLAQFEEVCASCGYVKEYLHIRHGNEVIIDLKSVPELQVNLGILGCSRNQVIQEIIDIRKSFFDVVDLAFPNTRENLESLGFIDGLSRGKDKIENGLNLDREKYPDEKIIVLQLQNCLSTRDSSLVTPKISTLIDIPYTPQLGGKLDTRQQSAINLANFLTENLGDGHLLKTLYRISVELSAATTEYWKLSEMLQDADMCKEIELLDVRKAHLIQALNNARENLKILGKKYENKDIVETIDIQISRVNNLIDKFTIAISKRPSLSFGNS